jgi:hypothetical protein
MGQMSVVVREWAHGSGHGVGGSPVALPVSALLLTGERKKREKQYKGDVLLKSTVAGEGGFH